MLLIRIKMAPRQLQQLHQQQQQQQQFRRNNKEWTCCFGLHVHTATIMIGIWHLFLNILALSLLAVIWQNPRMVEELEQSYDYGADMLPTPLSKVDNGYMMRGEHAQGYRRPYQSFDMGGLVCTCMIAITLMMIYGTIKGKPSHLLPFFCLQLFDFALTTLTAAGYLCYLQAVHRLISESHNLPWREKLLELSPEELVVVVLIVFICIVMLKAYAIGIVWRCYKYLTLRQQSMRSLLPTFIPDLAAAHLAANEDGICPTLLPNYEDAIAEQRIKQMPPPSYQVAMSNYRMVSTVDAMDNNNDMPNNNNTMHVNANTPTTTTTNALQCITVTEGIGANVAELVMQQPPPSYNEAVIVSDLCEEEQADDAVATAKAQEAAAAAADNNESQA